MTRHNTRLFMLVVTLSLCVPAISCRMKQKGSVTSTVESTPALELCEPEEAFSVAKSKKQNNEGEGPVGCAINGMQIAGTITPDQLSELETQSYQALRQKILDAYKEATKTGKILEGYKWFSNWWQGVNEICEATVGASPGATNGYKCIDKQGAIVSGVFDLCRREKFCLPGGIRLIRVDYNVGGWGEHHYLAVVTQREGQMWLIGNVDPWGNPNNPDISPPGAYNPMVKPQLYRCESAGIPRCQTH